MIIKDGGGSVLGTRTELFIEGPLFEKTGVRHKIKMDTSARNDTIMKPEAARMVSKYSDIGTILVYKMPIEEMLAEKFCALIERLKARDLYDAYFMLKYREVPYNEGMNVEKCNKRNETFDKKALLDSIDRINTNIWKEELAYLIKNLPELVEVTAFVKSKIL